MKTEFNFRNVTIRFSYVNIFAFPVGGSTLATTQTYRCGHKLRANWRPRLANCLRCCRCLPRPDSLGRLWRHNGADLCRRTKVENETRRCVHAGGERECALWGWPSPSFARRFKGHNGYDATTTTATALSRPSSRFKRASTMAIRRRNKDHLEQ
jgi:hypothetical protein